MSAAANFPPPPLPADEASASTSDSFDSDSDGSDDSADDSGDDDNIDDSGRRLPGAVLGVVGAPPLPPVDADAPPALPPPPPEDRDEPPVLPPVYVAVQLPLCGLCSEPITTEVFPIALGKSWHKEHFACSSCGAQLQADFVADEQQRVFCNADCFGAFDAGEESDSMD
jgi:hypothetical protein